MRVEDERRELFRNKSDIEKSLAEARQDPTTSRSRTDELMRRLHQIDKRLREIRPPQDPSRTFTLQARTAVLFKVAHAANAYLYGDEKDDSVSDEATGDRLEAMLEELDRIVPGWKDERR